MLKIPLKSIYAFLFLLFLVINKPASAAEPDTLPFRPNFTVGYDVSGQIMRLLYPDLSRHGLTLSYEWRPNWMATIETGTAHVEIREERHIYFSRGMFFKAGVNFNLLQNQPLIRGNQIFFLMRYGFGFLNHEAPLVNIHDGYWGEANVSFEKSRVGSHWAEFGGGLRTRLTGNLFIGWDVRLRFLLAQNQEEELNPYYIPGFGRGSDNTSTVFQYFIYYKFPLNKNRP